MQNANHDCPCSEHPAGVEGAARGAMTISPEAYELLSQAPLPSEFGRIVREGIPAMEIPDLLRTDPGIGTTSFATATPEFSVEPVEIQALAAPAETDRCPMLGATMSYLSEWRLDLTGVAHMTPGLQELADLPLGLICETQGSEDGWVFLCQRDGENGEGDEDGGPPVGEGIHTVVRGGCQLSAEFELRGFPRPQDTTRLSKLQPAIDLPIDLQYEKTLTPLLKVVPENTKDYPGTLRFWWTLDGGKIPLTRFDDQKKDFVNFVTSAGDTDEIKISAKDAADLRARLVAHAEETERARAGFFVRIPKALNATTPLISQPLEGHARWKPDSNSEECPLDERLTLHWHLAGKPLIPKREAEKDGDQIVASGTTVDYIDREGTPFRVLEIFYFWRVDDVLLCCGQRKPHEVIQFARVVYESDDRPKGHDWALDIREDEKQRARADEPYDPRFTNDPRGSNPGGSMVGPAPDGRPAIRQKDAPGMILQRYNELTLAPRKVPVRFQFLAFLVCPPDGTGDNPEDDYLGAKVVRVTLHEVLWDFPGRSAGNARPPIITPIMKKIVNVGCRETLGAYLDKNDLRKAYDKPVSSELLDLAPDEHRKLRDAVSNAKIKKP